jgi:hypothetical protein
VSVPISVAQSGISLGSAITGAGVWTGVAIAIVTLLGIMWKQRYPMKKLATAGDEKFRADLMLQLKEQDADTMAKVTRLEVRLDDQRKLYDEQRKLYETRLEFERVGHQNEVKLMRHRMNNIDQCFTMLLALIESNPEKAQEAARRVREMREKQEASEVLEKATIAAAAAVASSPNGGTPPPAPAPNPSTP